MLSVLIQIFAVACVVWPKGVAVVVARKFEAVLYSEVESINSTSVLIIGFAKPPPPLPPEITILPLPSTLVPLIVLMFVPDTNTDCGVYPSAEVTSDEFKVTAPVRVLKEVTPPLLPPDPFDAAVMRPCASTVMFVFVYDPATTVVFARDIVPVVVIVPPVKPVPVATEVTVPRLFV